MSKIKNKKVLITRANQVVGRATAEMLATEGVRVIATDINEATIVEVDLVGWITGRNQDFIYR